MPTVPRVTRQVATTALPGVRKTAAETALSSGAGESLARARKYGALADLGGTLGNVAHGLGDIAIQEREKADQMAVLEKSNDLAMGVTKMLYDPETGAMGRKGKDAQGLPEQIGGDYNKLADELEAGLTTPAQKKKFRATVLEREVSLDLTVRRHVEEQSQAYDALETQKAQENHVNLAIHSAGDPKIVGMEMSQAIAAAKGFASRNGIGPEALEDRINDITTKTHTGVIEQLLAQDQTRKAQVYFEETRSQINGDQIAKIEKALQEGKTKKEAQTETDKILAAGGSLSEQREKARAIEDPDIRDSVMQRLEHEDAVNDKTKRDNLETSLNRAYQIVDQTKNAENIPPAMRAELAEHMPALRSYAIARAKGVPIETDPKTWMSLMDLAGYDPEKFATTNLLQYKDRLDDQEFKEMGRMQLAIRNGDRKAIDHELDGYRSRKEIVENSLIEYGIDPKAKDTATQSKIAQFQRMVDQRVDAAQQPDTSGKRKKVDEVEMQSIVDGIFSQQVHREGGTFWDFFKGGLPQYRNGTDKRLVDYTIADVPTETQNELKRALLAKGRPATPATILNLFLEMQVK